MLNQNFFRLAGNAFIMMALCLSIATAPASNVAAADAADYPTKPITFIVCYSAGGGSDAGARILASVAEKYVGEPIVVQNKPGAGGSIGWASLLASKPDGYTMSLINIPSMILLPLQGHANYALEDIVPLLQLVEDPALLVVRKDGKFKTFEDVVKYAKENPGKLTVGNCGAGSDAHILTEIINEKLGIELNPVPFGGTVEAVTSVVGGHTDAAIAKVSEAVSAVESGKAILLAAFSDERLKAYPDVPTLKEKGVDLVASSSRGVAVPKGTPPEVIAFLHDNLKKATEDPDYKTKMERAGLAIKYRNGADFKKYYMNQYTQFGPIVKQLGLSGD